MIIDLREIWNNDLTFNQFGALLQIYCKEHNIEHDMQEHTYNNIELVSLEKLKLIKLNNDEIHLREKGKNLIESLVQFTQVTQTELSPFDEFWETFPSSDKHSIYYKTRNLKSNKKGCKDKYKQLLKEGVKHSDIIKALRYEVEERKKLSGADNKLSFIKNSFTWLNQREYDIILESMNESDEEDWTSNTI